MRLFFPLVTLVFAVFLPSALAAPATPLVVYAYEEFAAKGGPGPWLAEEFERRHKVRVRFAIAESEGALALRLEKEKTCGADVVVGVDQSLWGRIRARHPFESLREVAPATIPRDLWFDAEGRFAPFDWGQLALVYDSARPSAKAVAQLPALRLEDIATLPVFKKKVAFEDPRTSGVGLAFLLWTRAAFPDDQRFLSFWSSLTTQAAVVAPSWSAAYGLFLKGEVDFVLSYTTSPAYHSIEEKKDSFRALPIVGGHYRYVETAAVCSASKQQVLAKEFVRLLLSPPAQRRVPTSQWMFPAEPSTPLPEAFQKLSRPPVLPVSPTLFERSSVDEALAIWRKAVGAG